MLNLWRGDSANRRTAPMEREAVPALHQVHPVLRSCACYAADRG